MTKLNSVKKALAANAVAMAGYMFAAGEGDAIAALKNAVKTEKRDFKAVRLDFVGGQIGRKLWPTETPLKAIAKGKGVVGAAGEGRKPKAGQAVRTAEEETEYTNARQWFSRLARKAGIVTDEKRGGARTTKQAKKPGKGKGKAQVLAMPAVKDTAAAHAHLLNMAKMASGFVAKNGALVSPEASAAVADFVAKMATIAK